MAGRGSRLRPHTLTVPKPLIPVAGTPIVHQLVADIAQVLKTPIDEVAFIIGDPAFFDAEVEKSLQKLASDLGAKASIYRQDQPLGTGHAIMCAAPSLTGPAVVAYADTLIRADFKLDPQADAVIWVKKVENPSAYGVVQLNNNGEIEALVEKPQDPISDLAVIGIYYFKEIGDLKNELQNVLDQKLTHGGEYLINDGILAMMAKGKNFVPGQVDAWMDCGNPAITIETNRQMLNYLAHDGINLVADDVVLHNSTIIPPCRLASGVVIKNSQIGPYVSVGADTQISESEIANSIIQSNSCLVHARLNDSMIGNAVHFDGHFSKVSIGDFCELKQ